MSELTVRTLTEEDFNDCFTLFMSAFLTEIRDKDDQWFRNSFEPERFHGAYDGTEMIGTGSVLTRRMTLPGTGPVPVAAVTTVAVKPGHRRRGALTKMMRAQLHGLHEDRAEAFAALWASEGSIYGRFGYGMAAQVARVDIPRRTPFRPGVDLGTHRVVEMPREQAMPLVGKLYDEIAARRVGWLDRSERSWNTHLWDSSAWREGASAFRFAVHPEGYAIFRVKKKWGDRGPESEITLQEFSAATPVAAAALWRYLLDYDLVAYVNAQVALDDPLTFLLADPRQAYRKHVDSLWVRIVDVDRALVQRRYATAVDTVFELTDEFCPWNAGRWRLVAGTDGVATVERSTSDADLALDSTDLGAVFLGGTRLTDLAGAGRVRELTGGALVRASRAFTGDHAPHCPEVF